MGPDPWRVVVDLTGHRDGWPIVIELRIQGRLPRQIFTTQSQKEAFAWAHRFMYSRGFDYTNSEPTINRVEYHPVPILTSSE